MSEEDSAGESSGAGSCARGASASLLGCGSS